MTSAAFKAQEWLKRADELEESRKRQYNKVLFIESKVNNCISSYERTGARDPIGARAAHEDLLADYVNACEELETITIKVLHEDNITIDIILRLNNRLYRTLLFDRYINRSTIKAMEKSGIYNLKKSQLHKLNIDALEMLASILETIPQSIN